VIADSQFIAFFEMPLDDPNAVNADAVGAGQIPDHQGLADLGDATVPSGNFGGIQLDVAFRIAAQKKDGLV
jgi:hypothetical protein